jgi:hypothetical protein
VNFPEGAAKTILDEIVSSDDVLRQSQRVTRKSGNEGFDFLLEITLDGSLLFLIEWCFSGTSASSRKTSEVPAQARRDRRWRWTAYGEVAGNAVHRFAAHVPEFNRTAATCSAPGVAFVTLWRRRRADVVSLVTMRLGR